MHEQMPPQSSAAHEGYVSVQGARLFVREVGQGPPVVVLHGGPDFDHTYLLPELDRLADSFRLIYYDQRGRGRSAANVRPEDITIASEIADLDHLRQHLGLDAVTLLGHSWGGVLALEYALRHPDAVSHLILLNTAPVSHDDVMFFRGERRRRWPEDVERLRALAATPGFIEGDPAAVVAYYRVHFRPALRRPEDLDRIIERLAASFTQEGILTARAIEDRLGDETLALPDYDLLPKLAGLRLPTLVVHGDQDTVPAACAVHIAEVIPGARLVMLRDCGHFSYLERPDQLKDAIDAFFPAG